MTLRALRYITLISALLFAQTALLLHQVDLNAHHEGETCELCLHAGLLSHGLIGSTLNLPALFTGTVFLTFPTLLYLPGIRTVYIARAPPAAASF